MHIGYIRDCRTFWRNRQLRGWIGQAQGRIFRKSDREADRRTCFQRRLNPTRDQTAKACAHEQYKKPNGVPRCIPQTPRSGLNGSASELLISVSCKITSCAVAPAPLRVFGETDGDRSIECHRNVMPGHADWKGALSPESRSRRSAGSFLRRRGRTLIATIRSRRVSDARYTSPMPPAPSGD